MMTFPGNKVVSETLSFLVQILVLAGAFTLLVGILTNFIKNTTIGSRLVGACLGVAFGFYFSILYANIFDSIFRVNDEIISLVLIAGILINIAIVLIIYGFIGQRRN